MTTLHSKTVLITGATNGIGQEAAKALAAQGATVVFVARDRERANTTLAQLPAPTGAKHAFILADLTEIAQMRRAATEFRQRWDRLDVLLNNAGALFSTRRETSEGLERTFALNHLSTFVLTGELLPLLSSTAAATGDARVITTSSAAHEFAAFNPEDPQSRQRYNSFVVYGQSKHANLLFTLALARRTAGTGISANAMHPGFVRTGFGRNNGLLSRVLFTLVAPFTSSPAQGADTLIWLAATPELRGQTGGYYAKRKPTRMASSTHDETLQEQLWALSEQLTGVVYPDAAVTA